MKDFKDEIAEKFIQAMEGGTAPWQKAWSGSQYTLRNGVTGHEYSGLNVLRLCLNTYEDPRYCTFNQAKDKGWKIKKEAMDILFSVSVLSRRPRHEVTKLTICLRCTKKN